MTNYPKEKLVIRYRKKLKILESGKWFYHFTNSRDSEVSYYEVKPYDGKNYISMKDIIGEIDSSNCLKLEHTHYDSDKKKWIPHILKKKEGWVPGIDEDVVKLIKDLDLTTKPDLKEIGML